MELRGGHTICTVAQNYYLLQPVRGCNSYMIITAKLVSCTFNIRISSLRFLRVDYMDIAFLFRRTGIALYTIGVEYNNDLTAPYAP